MAHIQFLNVDACHRLLCWYSETAYNLLGSFLEKSAKYRPFYSSYTTHFPPQKHVNSYLHCHTQSILELKPYY